MQAITEMNMLVRTDIELPDNLKLTTDEFREGWNFARLVDVRRMEKKIVTLGWSLTRMGDGLLRSGVGDTSHEAIASALKLTLRHVSAYFNAAEVGHIELTQYPWFFLARVRVDPFRIQQGAAIAMPEEARAIPSLHRQRRLPIDAEVLYPHFGSAMIRLKQMLVSSQDSQNL
jgi:hypothetical protein